MDQRRNVRWTRRHRAASALIFAVVPLLGACSDSAGVDDPEPQDLYLQELFDVTTENNVQYGTAIDENGQEEALLLDLFQPTNDPEPTRPAVVWLHGGSFQFGQKGEMAEFAQRFAQRGYVTVTASYRLREAEDFDYTDPDDPLAEEVKLDAQHDAQAAVRWLRDNAENLRIDPDQIFIAGYSAGGTTALRVAAHPDDPGDSGNPGPSSSVAAVVAISASLEDGILEASSGPTLLIHGEVDTKVPFAGVEEACSAVALCQLVPVPEGAHDLIGQATEDIITEAANFLHDEVVGA